MKDDFAKSTDFFLRLCLLLVALLTADPAWAQATLSGTVQHAETGAPLPAVNVFASGTTFGAATESDGSFTIQALPPGRYEIVASMVGFEDQKQAVSLTQDGDTTLTFNLQPLTVELSTVEVTGELPRGWKQNLKRFETHFIGTTPNARHCEFVNPEVLDFTYDNDRRELKARAVAPLMMENRALGYRVTFHISSFTGNPREMQWQGDMQFVELEPRNRRQARRWERNRRKAYQGSLRHFLATLARDRHQHAGFQADVVPGPGTSPGDLVYSHLTVDSVLVPTDREYERRLRGPVVLRVMFSDFPEEGYVAYLRPNPEVTRSRSGAPMQQVSWLSLPTLSTPIHISGRAYDADAVIRHGYWSWKRFADELPNDYQP